MSALSRLFDVIKNDRQAIVLVILFAVISRVYSLTKPFFSGGLIWNINLETLRYHLSESLFYLHAQPPLHNGIIGIILKLSEPPFELSLFLLSVLNKSYSILTVAISYKTARKLDISINKSLSLSLLICLLPGVWMADRWMTSESLQFALLAISLYASLHLSKIKSYQIIFAVSVASLVLLKPFFHIILWLVPLFGTLFFIIKKRIYRHLLLCLFIFALAPYVKNYLIFDIFATSSWFGYNLSKTYSHLHQDEISALKARNLISSIPSTSSTSFSVLQHIEYFNHVPETKIDALDAIIKNDVGANVSENWNNAVFLRASPELTKNTIQLLIHFPLSYLETVANNVYLYFSYDYFMFLSNYGEWGIWSDAFVQNIVSIIKYFIAPWISMLAYIWVVYFLIRKVPLALNDGNLLAYFYLFALFVLIYFPVVSCLLECGEQARFRGHTEPLFLVVYTASIKDLNIRLANAIFCVPFILHGFALWHLFA